MDRLWIDNTLVIVLGDAIADCHDVDGWAALVGRKLSVVTDDDL